MSNLAPLDLLQNLWSSLGQFLYTLLGTPLSPGAELVLAFLTPPGSPSTWAPFCQCRVGAGGFIKDLQWPRSCSLFSSLKLSLRWLSISALEQVSWLLCLSSCFVNLKGLARKAACFLALSFFRLRCHSAWLKVMWFFQRQCCTALRELPSPPLHLCHLRLFSSCLSWRILVALLFMVYSGFAAFFSSNLNLSAARLTMMVVAVRRCWSASPLAVASKMVSSLNWTTPSPCKLGAA